MLPVSAIAGRISSYKDLEVTTKARVAIIKRPISLRRALLFIALSKSNSTHYVFLKMKMGLRKPLGRVASPGTVPTSEKSDASVK